MYPATPGSRFDWDYDLGRHRELSRTLLSSRGLMRIEMDNGIGGFPPGAPPRYHAVGHLFFPTLVELEKALARTAAEIVADESNHTDCLSGVQINEVVK